MRHHRHHYSHLDALLLKVYEKYPTNKSIDSVNKNGYNNQNVVIWS